MSMRIFFRVIFRRWWVIVLITGLVIGGTLEYSKREQRTYQATATVFAHPSKLITSPSDYSNDLGLLSYGSMGQTFASLAQSATLMHKAAATLSIAPSAVKQYTAIGTLVPSTTILEISVTGPDPNQVIRLANGLALDAAQATTSYFHIFTLTPLDNAVAPSIQILPQTSRNLLFGGLAGLIVGFVLAVLSVTLPDIIAAALADPDTSPKGRTAPALMEQAPAMAQVPAASIRRAALLVESDVSPRERTAPVPKEPTPIAVSVPAASLRRVAHEDSSPLRRADSPLGENPSVSPLGWDALGPLKRPTTPKDGNGNGSLPANPPVNKPSTRSERTP